MEGRYIGDSDATALLPNLPSETSLLSHGDQKLVVLPLVQGEYSNGKIVLKPLLSRKKFNGCKPFDGNITPNADPALMC